LANGRGISVIGSSSLSPRGRGRAEASSQCLGRVMDLELAAADTVGIGRRRDMATGPGPRETIIVWTRGDPVEMTDGELKELRGKA
jgi:hypothetical protein